MPERKSPTLRRRRVSKALRELREAAGLTIAQVERQVELGPGKVGRMERNDWAMPNLRDVRDLLDLYGVTDEARREELVTWAREGRQRTWWSAYKDLISPDYSNYIGLEAEASRIASFQTSVFPGLLQTPDYARALMANSVKALPPEQIEKRVEIRLNRQEQLQGPSPLELAVILDEAVLRRVVGSAAVMSAQLQHVVRMAAQANVTVYIVPFTAATHISTHGAFTIMEFPHPEDRNAVNVETLAGDLFMEEPEDVRLYELAFGGLAGAALDQAKSLDMLTQLI